MPSHMWRKVLKDVKERRDTRKTKVSTQKSCSTSNFIAISNPSSERNSTTADGKGSNDDERPKTNGLGPCIPSLTATPTHEDERFTDNPLGIGSSREFSQRAPASIASHKISESLAHAPFFPSWPPGSGHSNPCDTPGVKIIVDGVHAMKEIGGGFDTPGTEMIVSSFKALRKVFMKLQVAHPATKNGKGAIQLASTGRRGAKESIEVEPKSTWLDSCFDWKEDKGKARSYSDFCPHCERSSSGVCPLCKANGRVGRP